MDKKCVICSRVLSLDRAEACELMNKEPVCICCSQETEDVCYMDYSHKTAPTLVRVKGNSPEEKRRAANVFHRRR